MRSRILMFVCLFAVPVFAGIVCLNVFAGSMNFSSVDVASGKGQLVFFDKSGGQVYVYGSASGDLIYAWRIKELGEDLIKIDTASRNNLYLRNMINEE